MNENHTFIICAYKEVPYLDECVKSLLNQTKKSKVMISTSTPNDYIKKIAKENNVELIINTGESGHIEDFCFAHDQVKTKYVTLCHQDDIYMNNFAEVTIKKMEKCQKPIIAFSNYYDIKNNKIIKTSKLLFIKRLMNFPLLIPGLKNLKFIRKFILSLGNPICAPTVTYNKDIIEKPLIKSNYKSNIDWITYLEFSNYKGAFVYIRQPLILRRIHELSTTSSVINDSSKSKEDYEIFKKHWPTWIAKILYKIYSKSEDNNNL